MKIANKRVLVADDHAFVSWGLAKALTNTGEIDVVGSVSDGIAAIVEIRKTRPDCAILDYNMPGANGLEVYLESKRWSPTTKFVLLTGQANPKIIKLLVESGIEGVALKEGSESEILDLVLKVCAGKTAISNGALNLLNLAAKDIAITDRELSVLQALARGHSNASAAEYLGISAKTVDTHRTNLMRKFAVSSTASLLMVAVRDGFIDLECIR